MLTHPTYRQSLGVRGEALAAEFLLGQGYTILGQNFLQRQGELDLIAEKDGEIIFVEVKTRNSSSYGTAVEALTRTKIRKLKTTAWQWLHRHGRADAPWRLDLIAIDQTGDEFRLEHIKYLE